MSRRTPQRVRAVRPFDWAFPSPPVRREVLARLPDTDTGKPPLLFVHGLGHGAWCWDEHWLPAAAARGFPSYAVSLRGHGGSGGHDRLRRWRLRDYVHDVVQTAVSLPAQPVIVGHSLGGLVVAHALARYPARAAVLITPAWSPSATPLHIGRHRPGDVLRMLAGRTLPLRHEYLFRNLSREQARPHLDRCGDESPLAQYEGVLRRPPEPPLGTPPVLVVSTPDDALVPPVDHRRAARHYGVQPLQVPGIGHDMMLDTGWETALDAVLSWVEREVAAG